MQTQSILADVEQALQSIKPPNAEVWLSKWIPQLDENGKPTAWKLPIQKPYLTGFLKETEILFLMNENLFPPLADQIFGAGIPVFRGGGVRVLFPFRGFLL